MTDHDTFLQAPPVAGSEVDALLGALERNRRTFAWKCGGLDADAMRRTLGPSTITLGGLVKHLAAVEDHWFSHSLQGRSMGEMWPGNDWDHDPDWEWHSAADHSPEQLMALWQDAVARSRAAVAGALADGGLDHTTAETWSDGTVPNLRRLLVDMIEEYARHTGHADLVRESIDGLAGEGTPG